MLALFRGKGYREKFNGLVQSVPSFVSLKILRINEILFIRHWESRDRAYPPEWFLKTSELNYWLASKNEQASGLLKEASRVLDRQFRILGTDVDFSGSEINWHRDPVSNYEWSRKFYGRLFPVFNGSDHTDGKMPYELSRMQHLPFLIKGYYLSGHHAYVAETIRQLSNWIDNNPLNYGVNWTCTMDVAIRVCNWMWAWWAFQDHYTWNDSFNRKFVRSVWQHGWYIERHLENKKNIRTNHYLSDIVGLLFIGVMFPQLREADTWKRFGIEELVRSMDEMVYSDGVCFENSTAYHRLTLELFAYSAILCRKNQIELPTLFWNRLEQMFEFIMYCNRPDGKMSLIGDSDDGRFMILSDYYNWNRRDFRYLLAIGALLFSRKDFKDASGQFHEEIALLFGDAGITTWNSL